MISKGKFLQNANFYLPVLQEYFPFFTFHSGTFTIQVQQQK